MLREKRQVGPVLLKFGVALALSLGGVLYTILRRRKIKPSNSPRSLNSPDFDNRGENFDVGNEGYDLQTPTTPTGYDLQTPTTPTLSSILTEKHESSSVTERLDGVSMSIHCTNFRFGEKDLFLFPDFTELVKEFNLNPSKDGLKHGEMLFHDAEVAIDHEQMKRGEYENEIRSLKNTVKMLTERERILEIQLLEYYGLKEQETAVLELQNRLKINAMETKLLNLKIESLQADKRRLESQVVDYAKVVTELEAAKAKIRILKKKLRSEAGNNKEHILNLQDRVMKLQDQEIRAIGSMPDTQLKLENLKDLEDEAEDLRKSNCSLRLENSELSQKVEYLQDIATSTLEDGEAEALRQEDQRLRQQNEELRKEIEQLQADRCNDAEELVYLRWINACLRYELRNFQPDLGKTIARDLSKTLSPKSEEKAKQLILEYANKEGQGVRGISVADFYSDRWSSSQASCPTDFYEFDDSSVDHSSLGNNTKNPTKTKLFGKLMRLLRGKDSDNIHRHVSPLERTPSVDDNEGRYTNESPAWTDSRLASSHDSSGHSLDLQGSFRRSRSVEGHVHYLKGTRRNSDGGSSCIYRRIGVSDCNLITDNQLNEDPDQHPKSELVKYADALKEARAKRPFKRRSASVSFF